MPAMGIGCVGAQPVIIAIAFERSNFMHRLDFILERRGMGDGEIINLGSLRMIAVLAEPAG